MSTLYWSCLFRSQPKRALVAIVVSAFLCVSLLYWIIRDTDESTEQINQHRLLHLREACERNSNGDKHIIETSFYIHVKNESLLYCLVFKSGTTSWFYNINRWAGYSKEKILDDKTDNFNLARQKYPFENPTVLLTSMKNTYSFIVVRDPFERLISAYEERLLGQIHPYYKNLSYKIYRKYHDDGREYGLPTFQDFVRYVVDEFRDSHPTDLHWRPINDLCTPCLARYDFILKMETFAQDMEYLANRTQLSGKIDRVQMNHSRRDSVNRLIKKYFSQLTRQQLQDLYDIYKIDFDLFEYSSKKYFELVKP
uniref:Carbohydrate sulfotransferase n=1 Tax=Anopheles atroparvus TaxID=41427 RepID=A0AAG5DRL1_ANOAO